MAFSARRDVAFSTTLLSSLDRRRRDGSHADFVITCRGGAPLHAHKVILAAACPYFEALLSSGMSEVDSGELKLDIIERNLMEALLGYMYTGDIHVEYEQIQQLIAACELLQLAELKAKCEQYLIGSVSVESCIGVCTTAAMYGMKRLEKTCTEMMKSRFGEIIKVQEFLELDLAQLVDCIKLDIEKPEDVVQGCINWVLHDEEERKGSLQDLINHVDLETCSRSYLERIAKEYEGLFHGVQVKFTQAFSRPLDKPVQNIDTLWAVTEDPNVSEWKVMKYDQTQWLPSGDHNIVREVGRAHVTVIPDGFLLTGGQLNLTCINTFKHFSLWNMGWTDLPAMPNHRCRHASVYVDKSLFLFGGLRSSCKRAAPLSIDTFDFKKHTWTSKSKCFNVVYGPLSVELNGTIYVFCNQMSSNKDHPNCVQSYDINTDKWMKKSLIPNPIKTDGSSAISYGDNIYLLGGEEKICTRYNVAMDAWTILTQCINKHTVGGVLLNHNKIIIIGGHTEEAEEYDIAADKWMNCAKFRLNKTWSKVVVGHF